MFAKTKKREAIDLNLEFSNGVARILKRNKEQAAKGWDYGGSSTYFSASDLVRELRDEATRRTGSYNVRISTGQRGGLLGAARDYLFRQCQMGKLEYTTMGRGHISGARFRLKGSGPSEQEKRTMAAKERRRGRPRPRHWRQDGKLHCQPQRRVIWSRGTQSLAYSQQTDQAKVTCARCRKLLGLPKLETA